MFGSLKKKLKQVLGKKPEEVSKEELKEEMPQKEIPEQVPEKEILKKEFPKEEIQKEEKPMEESLEKEVPEELPEEDKPELQEEIKKEPEKEIPEENKPEKISKKEPEEEIKKELEEVPEPEKDKPEPEESLEEEISKEEEKKEEAADKDTEKEEPKQSRVMELADEIKEKEKGFFSGLLGKLTEKEITEKDMNKFLSEFELILLENNVALDVVDKISNELKNQLIGRNVKRSNVDEILYNALESSIKSVFNQQPIDIQQKIKEKDEPYTIVLIGFNGVGKTTTLAKLANYLNKKDFSVVLAAGDTFRAAALEQIEIHSKRLGIELIKHKYGADSAAVIFDAFKHAKAENKDVVIADTAGRSHSDMNLMDELKKIERVNKPDLTLLVVDSLTGNDAISQAEKFNEAIEIDGIILSKTDVAEKAGAALSVGYITGKPILFLGKGQEYDDFEKFDKETIVKKILD